MKNQDLPFVSRLHHTDVFCANVDRLIIRGSMIMNPVDFYDKEFAMDANSSDQETCSVESVPEIGIYSLYLDDCCRFTSR